jgi:hypothetical protein
MFLSLCNVVWDCGCVGEWLCGWWRFGSWANKVVCHLFDPHDVHGALPCSLAILAEGAIALPVTLSGGVLFAS